MDIKFYLLTDENENKESYKYNFIYEIYNLLPINNNNCNLVKCLIKEDADIIICSYNIWKKFRKTFLKDKKIIIINVSDSGSLKISTLSDDNILLYLTHTGFYDKEIYKLDLKEVKGRYHTLYLKNKYENVNLKLKQVDFKKPASELINKIHCIVPHIFRFKYLYDENIIDINSIRLLNNRNYDLFFAGSIGYGDELITKHREECIKNIKKLENKYNILIPELNNKVNRRKIKFKDYIEKLQNTKILVSPWGYGEFSHKDYEALMCGCILFKPGDHFYSYPNIYQDNTTCIIIKPDYSDLEEKILMVTNNLKKYQLLPINAITLIQKYYNKDILKNDFLKLIKEKYKKDE